MRLWHDSESDFVTSDDSLSASDFVEENEVQVVWAKIGKGWKGPKASFRKGDGSLRIFRWDQEDPKEW